MQKKRFIIAIIAIVLCGSVFAYRTYIHRDAGNKGLPVPPASAPMAMPAATGQGRLPPVTNSVFPAPLLASGNASHETCPRPAAGSIVTDPPDASAGADGFFRLTARNSGTGPEEDDSAQTRPNYDYRFCLLDNDQASRQAPVLRMTPGQTVKLALSNKLQPYTGFHGTHLMLAPGDLPCLPQPANLAANIAITNLHFHGMNISPACGGDEVINTFLAPPGSGGSTDFNYVFKVPANEPPGLYWYHPHIHGISQQQLLGGMTGVIVVAGMEKFFPETASLKERIFVLRDSDKPNPADNPQASPDEPWKNVSINYVPVNWNGGTPVPAPKIEVGAGERQFWRIANASADTHFVLKLQYRRGPNGAWQDQPLEILARDGVPVTADDGAAHAAQVARQAVLPPGARVEFIMTAPAAGVEARLFSADYNQYLLDTNTNRSRFDATDRNPARVLATLQAAVQVAAAIHPPVAAARPAPAGALHRFAGLRNAVAVRQRTLFFTKRDTVRTSNH